MTSRWLALGCLFGLFLCTGCDTVTVEHTFGDRVSPGELKKLEAVWVDQENQVVQVRAVDDKLVLGVLTWNEDTRKFEAETTRLTATAIGDKRFLFMGETDENDKPTRRLHFARYAVSKDGKTVHVHFANAKAFQREVEAKRLQGDVIKEQRSVTVRLKTTADDLKRFVEASKPKDDDPESELFFRKPTVTYRFLRGVD